MGKAARQKAQRRLEARPASSGLTARLTPARTLVLGVAGALVVAGVLICLSVAGAGSSKSPSTGVTGAAATTTLFRGIPQHGNVLGSPDAPATLVEFGEPQCPICGAWARQTLPTVVRDYVRTGKLRLVYQGISFIEPRSDSKRALGVLAAAGAQGREFQLIDLLYRNQGDEGSGWITEGLLRSLGAAVPGLDVERMMTEGSSTASKAAVARSASAATKVMGSRFRTPTFLAGRSGGALAPMPITTMDELGPEGFSRLLDHMTSQ